MSEPCHVVLVGSGRDIIGVIDVTARRFDVQRTRYDDTFRFPWLRAQAIG